MTYVFYDLLSEVIQVRTDVTHLDSTKSRCDVNLFIPSLTAVTHVTEKTAGINHSRSQYVCLFL